MNALFDRSLYLFTQLEFGSVNMATPRTNLDVPNVKEWSFRARSLVAARIAISYLTEFELKDDRFIIKRPDVQHTIKSNVEVAISTAAESEVDLARPVAPNVTYFEIIYFFIWSIMLVITQAWRDLVERRPFRSTLATESAVHYYVKSPPDPIRSSILIPCSTSRWAAAIPGSSRRDLTID